jgi:hypothetical protein
MTYYTRAEIGYRSAKLGGFPMGGPVQEAYVHHFNSGIQAENTVAGAMARCRNAQDYHISKGWGDIGYSFLVDELGNIYEGRGWFRTGAHTYGYNDDGYGICWLGDSNVKTPSTAALRAIAECIHMGQAVGALVPNVTVLAAHTVAHRDRVPDTSCCGDPMYAQLPEIRTYVLGLTPQTPTTQPQAQEEEDDMRFTAFRIPNGQIFIEDLQTGMRRDLMAEMPTGATATDGLNALQELVNAGIVRGGKNAEGQNVPYNSLGWNANWLLDQLDDVAVDDRVTE